MSLILIDGISQTIFVAIYVLRPVFTVFPSIYPSIIEFCLNYKYTVYRYDYMINLSRASCRSTEWRFRSKGPQKTDDYFGVKPPKKDPIINKKGRELGSRASIFRSIATQLS